MLEWNYSNLLKMAEKIDRHTILREEIDNQICRKIESQIDINIYIHFDSRTEEAKNKTISDLT